jgi:hypothetical protein
MVVLLGIAPAADRAAADSAAQINLVCANIWPKVPKARVNCREQQTAAANELLMRIEAASEATPEFVVANSCIERSKVKSPAMIDWSKALECFQRRFDESKPVKDSPT